MTLGITDYWIKIMNEKKFNADSYQVINTLFNQLESIFPAFMKAWPNEDVLKAGKKNWLLALVENNINTLEKLQIGLKKARQYGKPWVPSIGEFIQWCKPSLQDYGLPEPFEAFKEACRNAHGVKYNENCTWTHQAVYHAASLAGMYELDKNKNAFLTYYELACKTVFDGGVLKDLPKLIPNIPQEKKCPKTAKIALNEMLQKLGKKTNP